MSSSNIRSHLDTPSSVFARVPLVAIPVTSDSPAISRQEPPGITRQVAQVTEGAGQQLHPFGELRVTSLRSPSPLAYHSKLAIDVAHR